MDGMTTPAPTRDRVRRILATAREPLTVRQLADAADTTPPQAARVLRRLEDDGEAIRDLADGGCYAWTAASAC